MEKGIDYADSQIEKAVSTFAEAGPEEAQLVRVRFLVRTIACLLPVSLFAV